MDKTGKILTKDKKHEIRERCLEANAIYDYIEQEKLVENWKHDTERFIAFSALFSRDLVEHSITLSRLTKWLIVLTIALFFLGIMNFISLINN